MPPQEVENEPDQDDKSKQEDESTQIKPTPTEIVGPEKKALDPTDNIFPENMPPEIRQTMSMMMGMFQSLSRTNNLLFEKFTDKHVDKYLDNLQMEADNEYQLKKSNRWFYLGYVFLFLLAFGLAIYYLVPIDKDFLENIIQILAVLLGGLGGGYGIKSYMDEQQR